MQVPNPVNTIDFFSLGKWNSCSFLEEKHPHHTCARYSNYNSLLQLYLSMVRPLLEYACQVWHPHLTKDIKKFRKCTKAGITSLH